MVLPGPGERELVATVAYAGGVYRNTLPLVLGMVKPARVGLRYAIYPVEELLTSADAYRRHDATEFSLGRLVALSQDAPGEWTALPIFPARSFRHSAIYVKADSAFTSPEQLSGKRVGIPRWTQTAVVWTRGILQDRYGVDLRQIHWVVTSRILPSSELRAQDRGYGTRPPGYHVELGRGSRSLSEQLLDGQLDAVITANPLPTDPTAQVRHLFADPAAEEERYFTDTGIYPIMHAVVVSRTLLEKQPGLASTLVQAFEESRLVAERHWGIRTPVPFSGLAWENTYLAREQRIFAGEAWPHGLTSARNVECLETFLRYAGEQGVCPAGTLISDVFWAP